MSLALGTGLMAVLAVLQSTLLSRLTFLDGSVNLILLACVSWALAGHVTEALVWGFAGGVCLDLLSGAPLGVSATALLAVVYLASLTEGRFWEAHPLAPLGVMAVSSLVFHGITTAGVWVVGHPIDPSLALTQVALPATFLNVVLALPASLLAERAGEAAFPPPVRMG